MRRPPNTRPSESGGGDQGEQVGGRQVEKTISTIIVLIMHGEVFVFTMAGREEIKKLKKNRTGRYL